MDVFGSILEDKEEEKPTCKGIIWKAYFNVFIDDSGRIKSQKELRILKRKSCKGCDSCGGLRDWLNEEIMGDPDCDWLEDIEAGKEYTISAVTTRCPWSGEYDTDWDFVEVKEQDENIR